MALVLNPPSASMVQFVSVAEPGGLGEPREGHGVRGRKADISSVKADLRMTLQSARAPDIQWYPSYQTYQERAKRLAALGRDLPKDVPASFPERIDAARVWTGADFKDTDSFVVHLSGLDIVEIEQGLQHFKALPGAGRPDQVTPETFPLPMLGHKLAEVASVLHHGKGFAVLRGLNPSKYSALDNLLLYLGVTSYIAEVRGCQDYDGRMVVHIKDMEGDLPKGRKHRSPYTSQAQPFHTDRCDILAMYIQGTAAEGGESLLSSSGTIYNEIAATRPDVIHVLADGNWVFDEFVTPAHWHTRPLLYNFAGQGPSFSYSRRPLTGAPLSPHKPEVPVMSEEQAEALDMVHFTAVKHQLSIKLQTGDIEIFNNLAMFHSRNGFVDDAAHKRHAIRLWLKNEKLAWQRPEQLLYQAEELYDEKVKPAARWDIEHELPLSVPGIRRMTCS